MKKFMLVLFALSFAVVGSAQSKTKSPRKTNSVTQNTDTSKQQTIKRTPADTQLIAVVTMKKDTLFFNKDESICYTIKEVWDMKNYPDRPVILFVSNDQLKSVYNRVYGVNVKGPIKN